MHQQIFEMSMQSDIVKLLHDLGPPHVIEFSNLKDKINKT